jgi:DNA-binding response OmpR family regulator
MQTVMVVDDEHEKRAALCAALATEGFDAVASSSADALQSAQDVGPQLAIIDLMLHGTNGFELARRLRKSSPEVGVILTSDYHFSPTQLERMDCGAIAFVPRPFALAELALFLRAKLETRPDSRRSISLSP